MKTAIVVLIMLVLVSCTTTPTSSLGIPAKAIYLVQGMGQLSRKDLQEHPDVVVTKDFERFKHLARNKTALWIDINAVGLLDKDWLNQRPQRFYPIALIGTSNALCAFRDTLGGFNIIEGPYADCSSPPPGFSIWRLEKDTEAGSSAFMRGYEQTPTVEDILERTNSLLEDK